MKKTTMLLLALCLLLSACGKEPQETTEPTHPSPATEATQMPTTAPTETVKPEPAAMNPLTGEALEEKNDSRPYAIMLNNHEAALPHHGVGAADVIYETCVEGGMTRYMAIFSDPAKAGPIGSIRSARPPFVDVIKSYDAVYCSASAMQNVLEMVSERDIDYLNALTSDYFYRDKDRLAKNIAYEHTLFVEGEDLVNFAKDKDYRQTRQPDAEYGFVFDESVPFGGEAGEKIQISFQNGGKKTAAQYDQELGAYTLSQYGIEYVDGNTDEKVPFRNILILNANRWVMSNGIHVQMDTVGEGTGYYARDGRIVPIKWSRKDVDEPFTYTLEDGKPLYFGVGKTYTAIIQDGAPVEYQ